MIVEILYLAVLAVCSERVSVSNIRVNARKTRKSALRYTDWLATIPIQTLWARVFVFVARDENTERKG